MKVFLALASTFLISGTLARSSGNAGSEVLVQDEDTEKGQLVFQNNCLMCHSSELVHGQRLTKLQWEAEITKMVGWGAPVSSDEQPDLLAFLTGEFGPEVPKSPPKVISVADISRRTVEASQTSPFSLRNDLARFDRGAGLYSTHCASCHGADGRGGPVGTNLVERRVLTDLVDYREVVRAGRNKMPGFSNALKPDDEEDILRWLTGLPR